MQNSKENLEKDLNRTKEVYRTIFEKAKQAIDIQLNILKKNVVCTHCIKECNIAYSAANLFEKYPENCCFRNWQKAAYEKLLGKISKDIYEKIQVIDKKRQNYKCAKCSSCCKLASSEFTYDELKQKAANGDRFAKEFTSIFVPYPNNKIPEQIYPEYVALLEKKFDKDIQFYYCPKLGKDGLCTDYENRPSICRSFPENPLAALPPKCGFHKWKEENEITALLLHALIEIVEFYKSKLETLPGINNKI